MHQAETRKYLLTHDQGDDYILQLDNSGMETSTTCPRSFFYSSIQARVAKGGEALVYGSAHHEGLEAYYKGKSIQEVRSAVLNTFEQGQEMGWRTPESALDSVTQYIAKYKNETIKPLRDGEDKPMVEVPFSIPLGEIEVDDFFQIDRSFLVNPEGDTCIAGTKPDGSFYINKLTIFWTGKIDMFVLMDGGKWIMDHKTSSIKGESYYADFELSHQTVGYT